MGVAAMNRVAAITGQLGAIVEHIVGPTGYSLVCLCLQQVRDAILDAHDLIAAEIIKRESTFNARWTGTGGGAA